MKNKVKLLKFLVPILAFLISIVLIEVLLRIIGIPKKVEFASNYQVDSIYQYPDYKLDSSGIMSFTPATSEAIQRFLKDSSLTLNQLFKSELDIAAKCVILSYSKLLNAGQGQANVDDLTIHGNANSKAFRTLLSEASTFKPYRNFIDSMKSTSSENQFNKLLIQQYYHQPINNYGFRTVNLPLDQKKSKRTRVMAIGDSFTFGFASLPFQASFCDKLNQSGAFEVVNMGFPGADPIQYLQVLKSYLLKIKPDVVALFLNLESGNDIVRAPRTGTSNDWFIYPTNKGWFHAYTDEGVYRSNIYEASGYPSKTNDNFSKQSFLNSTSIGRLTFRFINKVFESEDKSYTLEQQYILTNRILKKIRKTCEQNKVVFKLFLLPMQQDLRYQNLKQYSTLLEGLSLDHMEANVLEDISPTGMHLSLQGHQKYGQWLGQKLPKIEVE